MSFQYLIKKLINRSQVEITLLGKVHISHTLKDSVLLGNHILRYIDPKRVRGIYGSAKLLINRLSFAGEKPVDNQMANFPTASQSFI